VIRIIATLVIFYLAVLESSQLTNMARHFQTLYTATVAVDYIPLE
jgi:hypothetical protein